MYKKGLETEVKMKRINDICSHPLFQSSLQKIQDLEKERIFCRHSIGHALDVARIAYIENLERELHISREMIYAAALLHDIGRHLQYTRGLPHESGSAMLAQDILGDCGFTEEEQREILAAIQMHRAKEARTSEHLEGLIYRADKRSRMCMFCAAADRCDWSAEKKNLELTV